jgi:hypothetical protein
MPSHSLTPAIKAFFTAYTEAFERFDAAALSDFLTYPCQTTSDRTNVPARVFNSPEDYCLGIASLIDIYGKLGVASGSIRDLQITELAPNLAVCTLDWDIAGADGSLLYQHQAVYTLRLVNDAWAIAAIAFNEMSRLQALLEMA